MNQAERKTILLVEDEYINAMAAKSSLEKMGYAVLHAGTGEGAIEIAKDRADLDLILMDIDLGRGMDGTEAAESILRDFDLPVVFLSSHTEREVVEKTERITSYGYVVKNSGITVLDAAMKMAFKLFEANRAIKAGATRNQSVLQTAMDGYWLTDTRGRILEVNEAACAMSGYGSGELLNMSVADLEAMQGAEGIEERIREVASEGRARFESRHRRKDGSVIDVEVSATYLHIEGGRIVSFIRDITEIKRTAEALRTSEARFRSLYDNTGSINSLYEVLTDEGGKPVDYRYLEVNPAFERLVGMKASDLIGRTLLDVFPKTERYWLNELEKVSLTGTPSRIENYSVELDAYTDLSIYVPQEGLVAMSSFDITERKRAEKALKASEEKYRSLIENSHDIIYTLDSDGRFTFVSPAWTALLGHAADQVVGKSFQPFVHPEDVQACLAWLRRAYETGLRQEGIEYRVRHMDGSWHWHASSVVPLRGDSGEVVGFEGTARDISERKAVEAALRAKSEELDLYFDSALDLLCIADTGGHFLRVNPEWEKVLGYSVSELEGRLFLDFVHPDDLEGTLAALAALATQEKVLSFVNRYRSKDGSWRWIEWRSHPKGSLIYAAARDITDRKGAEEEIRKLLAEKELILKEVHHRLKNNMSVVAGFLGLQAESARDEGGRAALNEAANRVMSMMLLYDRLYESAEYVSLSIADYLPALIDQVVANCARGTEVRVEKRIDDMVLDAKRMQPLGIIVNELLTNTMKHAFAGRPTGLVSVSVRRMGGTAILTVSDDGVGMPESSDSEKREGFGLTLVKLLSEQMRGAYRIERGGGTTAVVEFPVE